MKFISKKGLSTVEEWVSRGVLLWVGLNFAGYFLITTRHGSAIPAYFLALTGLIGFLISPGIKLREAMRSWSFTVFLALMGYLLLSLGWYERQLAPGLELRSVVIDVVVLVFAGLAFAHVKREIDVTHFVMVCLMVAAAISAIILLLIEIGGLDLDYTGAWNVWNVAAIAFGFVLLVALNYALTYRTEVKGALYAIVGIVSLAVVLLLNSAVVFFGLLVALTALSFAALWEVRFNRHSLFWVALCGVLMIFVLQVFSVLVEQKRSDIWASTVSESFTQGVIFGEGYSAISTPVMACESRETADCSFDHPHNLFVSLIYQLGLVGFLLLFVLYLVALGGLFERRSEQRWLLGGCLVYAGAIFMFDGQLLVGNMNYVWLILWLPMFLIMREEFLSEID